MEKELREQRNTLVFEIKLILDVQAEKRERAYNRDIGMIPQYDTPEYYAAKKALADFDIAHPEIEAERKASIERHMWD